MEMLKLLLDIMTFDSLENSLGASLIALFGGGKVGMYLMGLLFPIFLAFVSLKAGAGFEATVILSAFALFLVTAGVSVAGGGQGGGLPLWYLFIFLIAAGFVVYLAFFKKEV